MRKATSAIIGIIILIAIVIATATIVFIYINTLQAKQEHYVTGWVVNSIETNQTLEVNDETIHIWNISLADTYQGTTRDTYQMCFIKGMSPPPLDVHLKLFYYKINDVLIVYKIKSL